MSLSNPLVFKGLRKFALYFILIGYLTFTFIAACEILFTPNTLSLFYNLNIKNTIFQIYLGKINFFIIQILPFYAIILTPIYIIFILINKNKVPSPENLEVRLKTMSIFVLIFESISVILLIALPITISEIIFISLDLLCLYLIYLVAWPFIKLEN
ncbi:MAG: hypothetical protein LBE80_08175 [Deltaproteobacteria bacterium]|jgi:hypothetical protein|nr:hypothetical protein [Deltaproteobacteria bacterium]